MELLLASGNRHKKQEFELILPSWKISTPQDLNIHFDCDETGRTFAENALQKAEKLYRISGRPVIADDSGLSVEALNGSPGIHSARYGDTEARTLTAVEKYELLLSRMENNLNRKAAFVCALVLMLDTRRFFIFQETCLGEIADKPSGSAGFGYDPVFYIREMNKTMAELSESEKNAISHRGKAGSALRKFLTVNGADLGLV